MNDDISPQEWRIRREIRAAGCAVVGTVMAMTGVVVDGWESLAAVALGAAAIAIASHIRPNLSAKPSQRCEGDPGGVQSWQ